MYLDIIRKLKYDSSISMKIIKRFVAASLVIFILSALFYYKNVTDLYYDEAYKYSSALTRQIAISHDSIIGKMQEIVYRAPFDKELENLLKNFSDSVQDKSNLMDNIYKTLNLNTYFASVYIYLPQWDLVLTTDTGESFNLENFYDPLPISNTKNFNVTDFDPRSVKLKQSYIRNYISMTCKIPQVLSTSYGILVVNVDLDALYKDIIDQFNVSGNSNLYVFSEKNKIVMHKSYGLKNGYAIKNVNSLPVFEELTASPPINSKHMISQYYSTRSKLFFILDRDITGIINTRNMLTVLLFTFSVSLIGIVILSIISFSTLKPLKNIIYKITDRIPEKHHNELEFIDEFLTEMQVENEGLKDRYKETFPIYKQKLLQDILTSTAYNLDEITQKLAIYNISLSIKNYIALVLKIDLKDTDISKATMMKIFISDHVEKKLAASFGGFIAEIGSDTIGIAVNLKSCNVVNEVLSEEEYSLIVQFAEQITDFVSKEGGMTSAIGIGSFVNSIEELNRSYKEAEEALNYRTILSNSIVSIYHIRKRIVDIYNYPYDKEKLLLNLIRLCNFKDAVHLLHEIFTELKLQVILKDSELEYILLQLLSSINKLVYENQLTMNNKYSARNFLNSIKHSKLDQIEALLIIYIEDIIKQLAEIRDNKDSVVKDIINYIDNTYMENIQLIDLEEKFNLNRYYIGQLIKEHTLKNFNDYINFKRIEKSKEFLKDESLSVKEISEILGYSYANYFGRIFKQFEGITPGEYRNELKRSASTGF